MPGSAKALSRPIPPVPFHGWRVVSGSFFVLTLIFGAAYAFPAFVTPLEQAFPGSRGNIALVFALAGFLVFMLGAPAGQLADRFGARRVVTVGLVLVAAGLAAASFGQTLWQVLIAYGLGTGCGVALAYVPSVGPVQRWFARKRGTASSIAITGIGVGTFTGPLLAAWLMTFFDWRSVWLAFAGLVLIGGLLAQRMLIDSPQSVGQWPDGEAPVAGRAPSTGASWGYSAGRGMRTTPFIVMYIAVTIMSFPLFTPLVHLVPFAHEQGISSAMAVLLASLIGIGSIVGRFAIGAVADRFGRRRSFIATFVGLTAAFLLWPFATSAWLLGVVALLHGAWYGGFVALAPALTVDYLGPRHASGLLGALYTSVGPGTLIGPPLIGYAYDHWQSYTLPLVAAAAMMVISTIVILFLPDPVRWRRQHPGPELDLHR